jgi:hypothetical protein
MSSLIEEINKLKPSHIQNVLGLLLSVVAPGFLMVLHFWPKLFFNLDSFKLFFLAISLSLPVLAINLLMLLGATPFKNKIDMGQVFYTAMLISFMMLYACLLTTWYFKLSFGYFIVIIIAFAIIGLLVSYFSYLHKLKVHSPIK